MAGNVPAVGERKWQPRKLRTAGVLTGPRTLFAGLLALLFGRTNETEGYLVPAARAIELLSQIAPEAATWWREQAPHFTQPHRLFVFHARVCELISAETAAGLELE